jgi:hypothetical protein
MAKAKGVSTAFCGVNANRTASFRFSCRDHSLLQVAAPCQRRVILTEVLESVRTAVVIEAM